MGEECLCGRCHERPGTEIWSEGSVAYVHGCYTLYCKVCVLEEQLAHAQKAADRIGLLEEKLARARAGEDVDLNF